MKCSIQGCTGEYENREIVHTVRYRGEIIVFDRVPAEVCSICGDTLLAPETVRQIERVLKLNRKPSKSAPVYEFA